MCFIGGELQSTRPGTTHGLSPGGSKFRKIGLFDGYIDGSKNGICVGSSGKKLYGKRIWSEFRT